MNTFWQTMNKLLHIQSNKLEPKSGRVLIAEPLMGDYYFGRSVVLLIEHNNEDGTVGIVMNKPSGTMIADLINDFPEFQAPVYVGGPVQTDNLYFMHTLGGEVPESQEVIPGLYWGGEVEAIREMIVLGMVKPNQVRFFLGYSGWQSQQLHGELNRNSWLVSDTNLQSLFHTKSHKMWNHFMQRMGPEYDLWRKFPIDPELN